MSDTPKNTRLPGHLLSSSEYQQLKTRQGRGRWLQIVSFLPVIVGLLLIIFVFSTNISSAFSWFAIQSQGRGGSSGTLFPTSTVAKDEVIRKELIARGMTDEGVTTFFDDGAAFASYNEVYAEQWEALTAQALAKDAANLDVPQNFFVAEAASILKAAKTEQVVTGLSLLGNVDLTAVNPLVNPIVATPVPVVESAPAEDTADNTPSNTSATFGNVATDAPADDSSTADNIAADASETVVEDIVATPSSALESLTTRLSNWDGALTLAGEATDASTDALKDLNKEFEAFRKSSALENPQLFSSASSLLKSTTLSDALGNETVTALHALYEQYGSSQAILTSDAANFLALSQQLSESDIFTVLTDKDNSDALKDAGKLLANFADLQESVAAFNEVGTLESASQDIIDAILNTESLQADGSLGQYGDVYTNLSKASKLQKDIQKGLNAFAERENFAIDGTTLTINGADTFLTSGRYRSNVMEYYRNNWDVIVRERASNEGISAADIDKQIAEIAPNYVLSENNTISGFLEWAPLYRYDETLANTDQARIDEKLINGREFSQFADRNRVERVYVPEGEEGTEAGWYWVVHTQRDEIVMEDLREPVPYFAGRTGEEHERLLELAEADDVAVYMNPQLDWSFLTRKNSQKALMAGFYNAIIGTLWVIGLVIIFVALLGVGSALYLEEYAPKNWFSDFLEVNLRNLAGVPSIVYGILGLYIFVRAIGFGQSVISAALTLTLLILPVVIIAAREAIRAVPDSLRQASYGLGATKWQTVSQAVLPNAIPGIVTGVILAVARAIGETAPLLLVGGAGFTAAVPGGWNALLDSFSVMPLQIYSFYSMPNRNDFLPAAAAGILVLLIILIIIYIAAFIIRARYARK